MLRYGFAVRYLGLAQNCCCSILRSRKAAFALQACENHAFKLEHRRKFHSSSTNQEQVKGSEVRPGSRDVVEESQKSFKLNYDELPPLQTSTDKVAKEKKVLKTRSKAKKSASRVEKNDNTLPIEELADDRGAKTLDNSLTDFYQSLKDTIDRYTALGDDYVVLTQVGSFYELYFDHAERFSHMLGLTLTKKRLKTQDIAFSGFPDYRLDKYLNICFNNGLKAVVCDQVTDQVRNVIERPVNRLITPGTIVDDGLRDYHKNNYLLSILFPGDPFKDLLNMKIGLAWTDIGLGTFFVLETNINDLMANITRINPSEILLDNSVDIEKLISGRWFPELGDIKKFYITKQTLPSQRKKLLEFHQTFSDNKKLVISTLETFSQKETGAALLLLHYIDQCLPGYKTNFNLPRRSLPNTLLHIDPRAALDLELTETIRGGFKIGALSGIIDRTVTAPGSRLLQSWLLAPSTNVSEIRNRQAFVTVFLKRSLLATELQLMLKKTSDVGRIIKRIDNNRAELSEYLDLAKSIFILESMSNATKNEDKTTRSFLDPLFEPFDSKRKILKVAKQIEDCISPDATTIKNDYNRLDQDVVKRAWALKPEASPVLFKLRREYDAMVRMSEDIEDRLKENLQEKTGYNGSVKLIRDFKFGEFFIELRSSAKSLAAIVKSGNYDVRDSNKSVLKIFSAEWRSLGYSLYAKEKEISAEESYIINELKGTLLKMSSDLRVLSPIIEKLDITICFAQLAKEKNLVCPNVDKSDAFHVVEGRHLVVEEGLKSTSSSLVVENFTANTCMLNNSDSSSWVITGPNMGGKSTFLRQNALITILAQMGSFVPARQAHIGVIDKIFTRVGSSDNIYRHQSTFMVEMNETAVILRDATKRSLAIVDELGRGTSTLEGVSIAFSSLAHLVKNNQCKVLFATHFGPELQGLINEDKELMDKVHFYHTSLSKISEELNTELPIDERMLFDHKLHKGVSYHSHAFDVAELAGFPKSALKLAEESFRKISKQN